MPERKRAKRAKTVRVWAPVDSNGEIWFGWMCQTRAQVKHEMDEQFPDVKTRIARVEIREVTK